MLAAKSLQELMRSGGLQSEDAEDAEPGFADLLANAEPIPGGSALLGPLSLFEANKGSDGTLNIEAILQKRAKMAALHDHDQAGPSQTKRSVLDLSQAPPRPAKKPVIEVLGADAPPPLSQMSGQADDDHHDAAQDASDKASSRSSSDSDDSDDSESESDAEADGRDQSSARDRAQHPSAHPQRAPPHPMDQIAIVDGAFRIIPARSDNQGSSVAEDSDEEEHDGRGSQDEQMQDPSEDEASNENASEDEEDDEMDDQDEPNYSASRGLHQYHDGFGGMTTRNLLFEGPAGDADEPIVLSDDDEDGSDDDHEERDDAKDEDEEIDDDQQDEIDEDSEQADESEEDGAERDRVEVSAQQPRELHQHLQHFDQADEDEHHDPEEREVDEQGQEEDVDASQDSIRQIHREASSDRRDMDANAASTQIDLVTEQPPQGDAAVASAEQPQSRTAIADHQGDAMPDSEVEPEELDEDLRWSDIEADQHDDQDSRHINLPQSAAVDSAYRAIHGSQPTTGFVRVSQLLAGMQDAEPPSHAEVQASTSRADHNMASIDPEILASFAEPSASDGAAAAPTAVETEPSQLGQTASQTEADIFDAFTRQDASEPSTQSDEKVLPLLQSLPGEQQTIHSEGKNGDVDANAQQSVSQPEEEKVKEPAAPQEELERPEAPLLEVEASPAQVEAEGSSTVTIPRTIDASAEPVSEQGEDHKPFRGKEPVASATEARQEGVTTANPVAVPSLPSADEVVQGDAPVEPIKPVLERVESTDVLEADVEDNSEDEVPNEDIIVAKAREGSESAPHIAAETDLAEPEAATGGADSIIIDVESVRSAAARLPDAASEVLQEAAQNEASQPRSTSVVPEDEGIMSGDLADRDSSVERQAIPSISKAPSVAPQTENQVMEDAATNEEPAEAGTAFSSSILDKQEEAENTEQEEEEVAEENEEADEEIQDVAEETEEAAEENEVQEGDRQGSEAVEESPDEQAKPESKLESKPATSATEVPTVSEPTEQRKEADAKSSSSLHSLVSSGRVPPSPASSDRRSTSSFTPSANRLGHRHLHGAAKRNLFAQMTEAASSFASSLTAPLRSLPSLLPIRENQASEKKEDDSKQVETQAAEPVAESSNNVATRQPPSRSTKQAEPAEYTITTRSHCLYRRLELTDVEGTPAFIVPGCSINHENACAEKARDLGVTSEQESDGWIDVDPDLLPLDVHQKLSRVVGIQILREGIFAEPNSSAAELLMDGYELDLDLTASFDEKAQRKETLFDDDKEEHKTVSFDDEKVDAKEEHEMDITDDRDQEQKLDVQQSSSNTLIETEAGQEVKDEADESETPLRATRQSSRHRRAGSAASVSSHHRSPRRSDPTSPNADYLPDDERKSLYRDRHPAAGPPGDASIASLEEHLTADEEDEDGRMEPDNRILPGAEQEAETAGSTGEVAADAPASPSPPKRKRGRPRKSAAAADTSFKPSAQDEKKADQKDVETLAETKPKKGRGRKRATSSVDVSSDSQAQEDQGVQNAAAVEDESVSAAPKSKRSRRGRKSKEAAAFDSSSEEAKEEAAEEEDDNERKAGGSVRTRSTRKDEGAVLQQIDGEQHEEQSTEEQTDGSKVGQGGRRSRKRKQATTDDFSSIAEATAAETVSNADDAESVKQPRRSRRSQGGSRASSASLSKTTPRKNTKRKVLKLN
ncbi:hypothetical protein NDA16_000920 [Ustilago loliicola]|nr:hypothetical protein NDA16_000920 [Ustilago loliicola]